MFRSLSRITVAAALVLAVLLSAVPAQAQPRIPGPTLDASWLEAALGWLGGLLGGEPEALQSRATGSTTKDDTGDGTAVRTGPCIDPWGGCQNN